MTTLDDTITRDLAAVAADSRRAWRTADDALARLDVPTTRAAAPRLDALALTAVTQVFARRVARIAAGGAAMLVIAIVATPAFLVIGNGGYDIAAAVDDNALGIAAWLAAPMLIAHTVARQLAARWLATRLPSSASPDELARRLARRVDGWSTGVLFAAGTWIALVAGVLYLAFHRSFPLTPWFERFADGTTRMDRLDPLLVALFATVVVACVLGRAFTRALPWAPRTARLALAAGLAAAALTVGAGLRFELWPIAPHAVPTRVASWFLTVVGAGSVMLLVGVFAWWVRARDERAVATCPPPAAGAARIALLENVFARRVAWTNAGVASLLTMALVVAILNWPDRYTLVCFGSAPFCGAARDLMPSWIAELLVADDHRWLRVFVTIVAAHALGARAGRWIFGRVVGRAGGLPEENARELVVRVADASLAAVVAGLTAVATIAVTTRWSFPDMLPSALYALANDVARTTLRQLAIAIALIAALASLLGLGRARVTRTLRHPLALGLGVALAGWATWVGTSRDLNVLHATYDRASRTTTYDSPPLELLRPALILGVTVGAFLIFTWLALRWRGRTRDPAA